MSSHAAFNQSIQSLIKSGTKLWLDSVDPDLVASNVKMGVSGATSNPIIIADLIKSGRFDKSIHEFTRAGFDAETVAWKVTDLLVADAESVFKPIFDKTKGDDGYVSFELDPLLEDHANTLSVPERARRYVELAKSWSNGHPNRMIKVPATPGGLAALEDITAAGIPLNVTLIFSERQYKTARDAVWRGAQKLKTLDQLKSVYSIFVSRIDVYTAAKYPSLSADAQGLAGILNAQLLWQENQKFWAGHKTPLKQEIIFASTGTKNPSDKPWKYVAALAGSDIQTNPPATNDAVAKSNETFTGKISQLPAKPIVDELVNKIDWIKLEEDLMRDGLAKFADPHKALIDLVSKKAH
jgi:transaldolase